MGVTFSRRVCVAWTVSLLVVAVAALVPLQAGALEGGHSRVYDPAPTVTTPLANAAPATGVDTRTPSVFFETTRAGFRSLSAAEDTTTLYRAVNEDEFNSAIGSQEFSAGPNSMEGKGFAEQPSDALQWGQKFYGSEPFHVLQTDVPSSYADSLFSNPNLDGIGPARYADDLGTLNDVHGGISEYTR